MKSNKRFIATILITVAILIFVASNVLTKLTERKHFSQKHIVPNIASPLAVNLEINLIQPDNVQNIQELINLPKNENSMVVALSQKQNSNIIQAVQENGVFTKWDMRSKSILETHTVFSKSKIENTTPVSKINAGVNFSENGLYLITPSEIFLDELRGEIIWNTESLRVLNTNKNNTYQSLLFYPSNDLYFEILQDSTYAAFSYGFDSNGAGGGIFAYKETYKMSNFSRIAVDPAGDYLAMVDDKGSVLVGDINKFNHSEDEDFFASLTATAIYNQNLFSNEKIATTDLKFDGTHSWLAWLTDKKLVIWNLRNYTLPLHLNAKLEETNVLCFDRTGNLLFVGTNQGILVYDVKIRKQISEFNVGKVTAIYFTRDNHLLVWGDAYGNVHLWGIPK